LPADVQEEFRRLRKEYAELRRANQILKDVSAYFAIELDPTRLDTVSRAPREGLFERQAKRSTSRLWPLTTNVTLRPSASYPPITPSRRVFISLEARNRAGRESRARTISP
jgi:hypothetical protein